jgi:hypothetical protein
MRRIQRLRVKSKPEDPNLRYFPITFSHGSLKAPSTTPGTAFKEKDGTKGWELGSKRRITVSKFKGKKYVGIREYYEDNGKLRLLLRHG